MLKKLKNLFGKTSRRAKRHPRILHYEELEQRVLFSADVAPGLDSAVAQEQVVTEDVTTEVRDEGSSEQETADPAAAETRLELVIVNDNLTDYEQLIADLQSSDANRIIEVVVLDGDRDGIEQVSDILADRSDLAAVHFITHGAEGVINLGNSWLSSTTLEQNIDAVQGWGNALNETGDLLFYGCNIAADGEGQRLVDHIAQLTGADVAASDDLTGHAAEIADWTLEYSSGAIETGSAITETTSQQWDHLLATLTVDTLDDVVNGNTSSITMLLADSGADGISLREAIIAANNTAGDDTIVLGTGTYTLSINVYADDFAQSGDLDIRSNITIIGDGIGQTIIDANAIDRVFHVISGTLTLSGLEVTGGNISTGEGGGIRIEANAAAILDQVDVHD
ncbi:MAG: DUF4347 domain-containing protein, partial [Desulfobacteraceae bacterium]